MGEGSRCLLIEDESEFAKVWERKSVHMMRHTFVYIYMYYLDRYRNHQAINV